MIRLADLAETWREDGEKACASDLDAALAEVRRQIEALTRHQVFIQHKDNNPTGPIEYVAMPAAADGAWVKRADVLALFTPSAKERVK